MSAIAGVRSGRFWVNVAYTLLTLVIVAAGFFVAWYRVTYNVWPVQGASSRVHWCERDYETGGGPGQSWQAITTGSRWPIRAVDWYPPLGWSRQQLFAPIFPGAQPGDCGTAVYLRTGPNAYQAYALLGGP
jgi:hypothetical protein